MIVDMDLVVANSRMVTGYGPGIVGNLTKRGANHGPRPIRLVGRSDLSGLTDYATLRRRYAAKVRTPSPVASRITLEGSGTVELGVPSTPSRPYA